jgi:hypothetical protein
MKSILVVNPCGGRTTNKTKTKGNTTMARRRRKSRKAFTAIAKPARRGRRRRNPSARVLARAAGGRARSAFGGLHFSEALRNVPLSVLGMFAAKWSAKTFGEGEREDRANETDPETWDGMSYLKGSIGAFVAGFLGSMVRPKWGQKILEGGLSMMAFKVLQNELIPKSEWATRQFGASDEETAIAYGPDGVPYLLGQGYEMPVDERHRLPEGYAMLGDQLEVPGRLGSELEPPGRLGDTWENAYFGAQDQTQADPFKRVFHGR